MKYQSVDVIRISMRGPGDMSGLETLLGSGQLDARDIVAILGKTEGNGCVNDFTREYASLRFAQVLAAQLDCSPEEVGHRVALVMSGGTEGVLSPHATVFARRAAEVRTEPSDKRLAVGIAHTRDFLPEELGRSAQIEETRVAVLQAMADAGIEAAGDVHFVQIKCPLLTAARIAAAQARGHSVVTTDTYASMAYSRGASALGVAAALGEIASPVDEAAVLSDWRLYSGTASTSAGIELMHNAIVVMGNSAHASSGMRMGHGVMHDAIDMHAAMMAFAGAGIAPEALLAGDTTRIVNVLAKAEASPDGKLRAYRHTMLDDSDIASTRHARAAVGGLLAALAGCPAIYVSGGAEHQGPAGGGPVAVIARCDDEGM